MMYVVTETPDDPSLNACWVGEAPDALRALDAYMDEEDFARYSDIVDPRNPQFSEDERVSWMGQDDDGTVWAIFTNSVLYAIPFEV